MENPQPQEAGVETITSPNNNVEELGWLNTQGNEGLIPDSPPTQSPTEDPQQQEPKPEPKTEEPKPEPIKEDVKPETPPEPSLEEQVQARKSDLQKEINELNRLDDFGDKGYNELQKRLDKAFTLKSIMEISEEEGIDTNEAEKLRDSQREHGEAMKQKIKEAYLRDARDTKQLHLDYPEFDKKNPEYNEDLAKAHKSFYEKYHRSEQTEPISKESYSLNSPYELGKLMAETQRAAQKAGYEAGMLKAQENTAKAQSSAERQSSQPTVTPSEHQGEKTDPEEDFATRFAKGI